MSLLSEIESYDVRFVPNFTCLVAAPSNSGKTYLVLKILEYRHLMFRTVPNRVIYFYRVWQQDIFSKALRTGAVNEFIQGLPTRETLNEIGNAHKSRGGAVIVIDDFMLDKKSSDVVSDIFTVLAHHWRLSCFYITQNIFSKLPGFREISINATYMILMKNPRERTQMTTLARQLLGSNYMYLVRAFEECTEKPFSYMLIDNSQSCSDIIRFRSNLLPNEQPMIAWMSTKKALSLSI